MSNHPTYRVSFRADPIMYRFLREVAAHLNTTPCIAARYLVEAGMVLSKLGLLDALKGLDELKQLQCAKEVAGTQKY